MPRNQEKLPTQQITTYSRPTTPAILKESQTIVLWMDNQTTTKCPHYKYPYESHRKERMRQHFQLRHSNNIIIIQQECLLLQCINCGLFQQNVNMEQHKQAKECQQYTESKRKRQQELLQYAAKYVNFHVDNQPVSKVKQFKYLGRIITDDDDNLPAVEQQIGKARTTWGQIGKIIQKKTNANTKVLATFYKTKIQSILLYQSKSWTVNKFISNKLNSFHHCCAQYKTGKHIKKLDDDSWNCLNNEEVLKTAGLLTITKYIEHWRQTIATYMKNTPIFQECIDSMPSPRNTMQIVWWNNQIYEENEREEI
jgi:hypothetical protein